MPPTRAERARIRAPLRVERADREGVAVLTVSGELDLASAPILERQLDAVDAHGAHLVVDLSECGFIDSTGLTVLVQAAARDGRSLVLLAPNPKVRRLLELTRVETLMPVFETMADAQARVSTSGDGVNSDTPDPDQVEGGAMYETPEAPETPVTPGEEEPGGNGDEGDEGGEVAPESP